MFPEPMSADGQTLRVQLETLRQFKRDIDAVIDTLEGSAAGPKHISSERIGAGHLGKGFAEASSLMATYTQVHDQLENFSGQLKEQIEAMQISVDCAARGYTNVDLDQREKVWQIYHRNAKYHQQHPDATSTSTPPANTCSPPATSQGAGGSGGVSS